MDGILFPNGYLVIATDLNFPVCADQLFVKRAVYGGAKAYYTEFLSSLIF